MTSRRRRRRKEWDRRVEAHREWENRRIREWREEHPPTLQRAMLVVIALAGICLIIRSNY